MNGGPRASHPQRGNACVMHAVPGTDGRGCTPPNPSDRCTNGYFTEQHTNRKNSARIKELTMKQASFRRRSRGNRRPRRSADVKISGRAVVTAVATPAAGGTRVYTRCPHPTNHSARTIERGKSGGPAPRGGKDRNETKRQKNYCALRIAARGLTPVAPSLAFVEKNAEINTDTRTNKPTRSL